MTSGPEAFVKLVSQLDYSMFIVTVSAGGERAGCLIGIASQVSINPGRFLACLSVKNRTYRVARSAHVLVVHFLAEDQVELAELFGSETGDELDKFERCEWRPGPEGTPVLSEAPNWFAGRVLERLDLGDHCGFLLEPVDGDSREERSPLRFGQTKWIEPGHEP